MSQASDLWYVRLPDGRVVRARSTAAVRHHIETGRIPFDSRVRRDPEEDWITLEWSPEFADLIVRRPRHAERANETTSREVGLSARLGEHELRTVGVRGLVDELLAALDSTLQRRKLQLGIVTGFGAGLMFLLAVLWHLHLPTPWPWLPVFVPALGFLLVASYCMALLTQMTVVELSRFRPATRAEARAGLARHMARLALAYLFVVGGIALLIAFLRWLPTWLLAQEWGDQGTATEALAGFFTGLRLVLEVLLWPFLGLSLLLAPVIVVEEKTVAQALRQWSALLRSHLSRVFLYEALAAALGTVASLPFLVPVLLAGWLDVPQPGLGPVFYAVLLVLTGLALAPLFAYLIVANVFIYLTLRYEFAPSAR